MANLAFELGVFERTVRRDIEALTLTEPIYTQAGRYGGGIYVVDGYRPNKKRWSSKEYNVLNKLLNIAEGGKEDALRNDEIEAFKSIIASYSKPII